MIEQLKQKYGRKCTGIKINETYPQINVPSKKMSLCEGIKYSFDIPLLLNEKTINCAGARRSLGIEKGSTGLIQEMAQNLNIPPYKIETYLNKIPVLGNKLQLITMGITSEMESFILPDVFIIYMKPYLVAQMLQELVTKDISPVIANNQFLSACGAVLVNSYINQCISVSFGCNGSHENGGVENDDVIVGIPFNYFKYLI